jgi:D-lactate dehydrogenase
MDDRALACIRQHGDTDLPEQSGHVLIAELSGKERQIEADTKRMMALAQQEGALFCQSALGAEERRKIWDVRRALSPSMAYAAERKRSQDVCVPAGSVWSLLEGVQAIARHRRLQIITFGHLGDGNVHVNIMSSGRVEEQRRADAAVEDVYRTVLALKGTLSGEHGIGMMKRHYLGWELSPGTLSAQQKVKAAFDPRGLLNPDKIFVSSS